MSFGIRKFIYNDELCVYVKNVVSFLEVSAR